MSDGWSTFVNDTPLRDMFYNPKKDEEQGAQGAQAGTQAWNGVQPTTFSNVDYQGPEQAADAKFNPVGTQTAQAAQMQGNAYNDIQVDPQMRQAQTAQLQALQDLAKNGGMNAQDKANLAGIQNSENQNERGQRQAILQNAQMRGAGTGGNALLAQLVSGQGSANRQSQQDMNVAGMAQNRALQAGQGAAGLAGSMEAQQYGEQAQKAAAQNAIAQFNAQNSQQANLANAQMGNQMGQFNAQGGLNAGEFNANKNQGVNNAVAAAHNQGQYTNNYMLPAAQFGQQAQIAGGKSGAGMGQAGYYQGQEQMHSKNQNGVLGGAGMVGGKGFDSLGGFAGIGSMLGMGGGEAAGGYAGADAAGTAGMDGAAEAAPTMIADRGGKVPGLPKVPGDSPLNDIVPMRTSPGEVVVPRTLAQSGTKGQIGSFVKHPPSALAPDHQKEAMLSALKEMRKHGGR